MLGDRALRGADTTEPLGGCNAVLPAQPELAIYWISESGYSGRQLLRGARLYIGRGEDCHLRLEHGSVSRRHAELYRQGPIYALRDLGSTNGTHVNGERLEHTAISAGDLLRFGERLGVVVKLDPKAALSEFGALAPGLWGGPSLVSALAIAKAAAPTDVPIVLVGETGAGKERVARALHDWSQRAGRFHAVNCSAVPAQLAEAELFGHQRGAFTGADRNRVGHFQAAHGGTLFLDEIADLSLEIQAKLLRVVEEGEVVPLGGTEATRIDTRIIVASHQHLDRLVEQRKFRSDLYARLAGFVVEVPPLRERREELAGFVYFFLEKHGSGRTPKVASALLEWLCLRDWPGNVRELELFVRKLLVLYAAEPVLELEFARAIVENGQVGKTKSASVVPAATLGFRDRRESDLHRLKEALVQSKGNLKAAAACAGISRRRAYRLLADKTAAGECAGPPGEESEGELP